MRLVLGLLLALMLAPVVAPIARMATVPADAHGCCPDPVSETAPAAPCQYLAPLGCCAQTALPAGVSSEAPALHALAFAAAPAAAPAPAPAPRLAVQRSGHGPPQAPLLRAVVLQL